MSISSGSYTVGSGGDYATFNAAFADIAATLTGNLTLTLISNITESATITYLGNINGYTLKITCDPAGRHNGIYSDGYLVTRTGGGLFKLHGDSSSNPSSSVIIEHLKIIVNANGSVIEFSDPNTTAGKWIYRNLIIDKNGHPGNAIRVIGNGGVDTEIVNCLFINGTNFNTSTAIACDNNTLIQNVTIYKFHHGVAGENRTFRCENISVIDNYSDAFIFISSATGYNNCSNDATADDANWATGSGNLINKLTANCVVSLNPASPNFMYVLDGGDLHLAGYGSNLVSYNNFCIRENPRSAISVSIGACESGDQPSISYSSSSASVSKSSSSNSSDSSPSFEVEGEAVPSRKRGAGSGSIYMPERIEHLRNRIGIKERVTDKNFDYIYDIANSLDRRMRAVELVANPEIGLSINTLSKKIKDNLDSLEEHLLMNSFGG
jgi:hypothetical protein